MGIGCDAASRFGAAGRIFTGSSCCDAASLFSLPWEGGGGRGGAAGRAGERGNRLVGLRPAIGAETAFFLRRRGLGLRRGLGDRAILILSSMLLIYSWIIRRRYSNIQSAAIDFALCCGWPSIAGLLNSSARSQLRYHRTTCRSREDAEAPKFQLENSPQVASLHRAGAGVRRFNRAGLLFHGFIRNAYSAWRVADRDPATCHGCPRIPRRP